MLRLSCFLLLSLSSLTASATPLTFATFNIRFFGMPSDSPDGTHESFEQDRAIRSLLEDQDALADVIAFQEIVDVDRLRTNILKDEYRCVSYQHWDPNHIHVVICHKNHLRFEIAADDDDFAIDEVTLGSSQLRPGVHGILKTREGKPLAHIVALHLKANGDHSDTRAEQMEAVAAYLADQGDHPLPFVVLGDVNSHSGDLTRFNRVFDDAGLGLRHLYSQEAYTWRIPTSGRKFDRIWVSKGSRVRDYPDVVGPCNVDSSQVDEVARYNEEVSDHCPVKFALDF